MMMTDDQIRERAKALGIDPDLAVRVWRAEGKPIPPEKEALFVDLLKTEYLILCAAVLAVVENGDIDQLWRVARGLPAFSGNPLFRPAIAEIDAKRAAEAAKAAELLKGKPEPKKATGPSPWSL